MVGLKKNFDSLKKSICTGLFKQATSDIKMISEEDLDNILFDIASPTENICSYSFIYYCIAQRPSLAEYHLIAFSLLSHTFHYLCGYECSLHHVQRVITLDPHDLENHKLLIFLNETPPKETEYGIQRVVTNNEVKAILNMMLEKKPVNEYALKILKKVNKTEENDLPPVLPSDDINDTIQQTISAGRFLDMRNKINLIDQATLKSILFDIAKEKENICAYAFPWFLILEHGESALYHELAADVLIEPFSQLVGAFYAARYHINRALELDPNNKQLEKKHNEIEKIIKNKEIENNENQ